MEKHLMRYHIEHQFGSYQGVEFYVDDKSVQLDYINDELNVIKQALSEGIVFHEGRGELRIGWMLLEMTRKSNGYLQLMEPDFHTLPAKFVGSLNKTFLDFQDQVALAKHLGLSELFSLPTIGDSCIVCSKYDRGDHFVMERYEEAENDSGWYVGCADQAHDHNDSRNLRRVSLYEACLVRPSLAKYVGLPTGTHVQISPSGLVFASYNGTSIGQKTHPIQEEP